MASPTPAPLPIVTARLVLRTPKLSDAAAYAAIMSNPLNNEHSPEFDPPESPTAEAYAVQIADTIKSNAAGEKALTSTVLKNPDGSEGPVIGMGGFPFLPHNANGRRGNTGALIDSASARKGYATEQLIASLDFGFDVLGFEEVEQDTEAANTAYIALMNSMGLAEFGVRRWSDRIKDWEMNYALTRAQWQQVKAKLLAKKKGALS